jgi:hypothetical protein
VPQSRLWADFDKDDNEDIIADLNTLFARPAANDVWWTFLSDQVTGVNFQAKNTQLVYLTSLLSSQTYS